jgi:nucleotide-binding universal stress UspA family protein
MDRLVVPVQGTDREFEVQQWATELAASLDVPVHALHVSSGQEEEIHGDHFSFIEKLCEKWGVELTKRIAGRDDVAQEILDELAPRDLVVIGTRRMANGGDYHVGSVTAELVRHSPCPVQIVRLE